MDTGGGARIAYDDYPVVFLPPYESPPAWIPPHERIYHSDYNNELTQFLPRTIVLKKPPGAQLGFNIRGGKASQLGIFISKVIPDSDAHRAGLQEGDQVLAVNDVDFQDIEHSKITRGRRRELSTRNLFPARPSFCREEGRSDDYGAEFPLGQRAAPWACKGGLV
ncbi:PDZ domain-containing protein 11 isoform X3 [Varanus komodoensis]|uniref:PDZ domain containing 11 n=2 Tax=Varanus komodoensis TaxID=61221 RepID=A0A8D2LXV7_VARKO|nr:PDZ domain-containing protein 11 isoform X3 [Varanus komodoensis]XP_044273149.1 PDZ domain-containing protein 11 isoform X3 [Varanus komodoensis]XP_044273150.1 PDZ domain-containing protein 11 isoform X3 [Varanus komodoensis]